MKKRFIIMLLVSAVFITGCSTKNEGGKAETKAEHFNFTTDEIVNEIEQRLIDMKLNTRADYEEENAEIVSYNSNSDYFNSDSSDTKSIIHYQFIVDNLTGKVKSIHFFCSKDANQAISRYFYHIFTISSIIDTDVNNDDISNAINIDEETSRYNGKDFEIFAMHSDKYYTVIFSPAETN